MDHMAQRMDDLIEGGISENERLCLHIEELERLIIAADRAVGTHNAPDDCYATGPLTGDPIADLVECPACIYLTMREKVTITQPKSCCERRSNGSL